MSGDKLFLSDDIRKSNDLLTDIKFIDIIQGTIHDTSISSQLYLINRRYTNTLCKSVDTRSKNTTYGFFSLIHDLPAQ